MLRHLAQWAGFAARAYQRRRAIEDLSGFSDRELADIGIVRGMIPDLVAGLQASQPERKSVRARPVSLSSQACG